MCYACGKISRGYHCTPDRRCHECPHWKDGWYAEMAPGRTYAEKKLRADLKRLNSPLGTMSNLRIVQRALYR